MSVAAAIAGGLVSSAAQLYANNQNIKANDERFGSEVELANTAHRREMEDLQAAGLNPILSASGSGAAVPQLGAASVNSIGDRLGDSIQSAGRLAALDVPLKQSQVALNSAQAQNLRNDGVLKEAQAMAVLEGLSTMRNSAGSLDVIGENFGNWLGRVLGPAEKTTGPIQQISPRVLDYILRDPDLQDGYMKWFKSQKGVK